MKTTFFFFVWLLLWVNLQQKKGEQITYTSCSNSGRRRRDRRRLILYATPHNTVQLYRLPSVPCDRLFVYSVPCLLERVTIKKRKLAPQRPKRRSDRRRRAVATPRIACFIRRPGSAQKIRQIVIRGAVNATADSIVTDDELEEERAVREFFAIFFSLDLTRTHYVRVGAQHTGADEHLYGQTRILNPETGERGSFLRGDNILNFTIL